jgi:ferredoxin--NADP+ reductase
LPGLPFNEASGTVPHDGGRVLEVPGGRHLQGLYVAGWAKRGASGVIGTSKPDSEETVRDLLEDVETDRLDAPVRADRSTVLGLLARRGVRVIRYEDWQRIDRLEQALGARSGRPRVKLASLDECLAALDPSFDCDGTEWSSRGRSAV